jgi:PD-(D/E)XK nuclease superfamily
LASTTIEQISAPPVIPSKWDIIPIHTSDRGAFKECRRRWAWSSPSRRNLTPRIAAMGVYMPFWFGTGIHKGLQYYYGKLTEDPVTVFETWFDLQWNGGLVHESEMDGYVDRDPIPGPQPQTYFVSGIKDLMPSADERYDEFMEHLELGKGMLRYYMEYAQREDDFRVVANEHLFSVPIMHPDGTPLYAIDNREMPEDWQPDFDAENMFGPIMRATTNKDDAPIVKQVHARGRMDQIVQLNDSGAYVVRDYKTVGSLNEDYFRHLELDEQCTTYLWAAPLEAAMYGLEYTELNRIHYVALRKAYPKPPTPLKNGMPSINRQTESTTAEMFTQYIKDNNLKVVYDQSATLQAYYAYLLELGEKQFIWTEPVTRNKAQIQNAGIRLYHEALDMLDPDLILYPNPSKNYSCLNCRFRAPCIAAEDGSDWQSMLDGNYIRNYDR